ncbi:VWA domain-containing protein-like protein [Leptotrombidium deliense]|uniref:VWA domain-containing protein-like protein n=1 Tax=Leptotrombidium deliense TaxID=299467 RepID=A0A443S1M8_9ACAR|nr:VWA domain-containing protein-like protein [Leptotrombidium deliense]
MKTIICMIVDESGSMGGNVNEVVEGYNTFIQDQLKLADEARLHLLKFNDNVNTVLRDVNLANVPLLGGHSYTPGGNTALFDAMGDGINSVASSKRIDERAIVVIITDGYENASRRYTEQQVRDLIARYKAHGDWSFVYIGECSQQFAARMGIPASNAINFCHEKGKIRANFEAASAACTNLRSNKLKASDVLFNN